MRNWQSEVRRWCEKAGGPVAEEFARRTRVVDSQIDRAKRLHECNEWQAKGGLLIIGYEMFANLVSDTQQGRTARARTPPVDPARAAQNAEAEREVRARELVRFQAALQSPGPSLVILDEAHLIKNPESKRFKAINAIRTRRRIALTGTPLQNNLKEYHTMITFARGGVLGTDAEFKKRFADPITNGMCEDSTKADVRRSKQRTAVLLKQIKPFVLRRDEDELLKLISKTEFIVTLKMTRVQKALYRGLFQHKTGSRIFELVQPARRLANHPASLLLRGADGDEPDDDLAGVAGMDAAARASAAAGAGAAAGVDDDEINAMTDGLLGTQVVLKKKARRRRKRSDSDEILADDVDDDYEDSDDDEEDDDDDNDSAAEGNLAEADDEAAPAWSWPARVRAAVRDDRGVDNEEACYAPDLSAKMVILLELLVECLARGDRMVIFSQSLPTLDYIERVLQSREWGGAAPPAEVFRAVAAEDERSEKMIAEGAAMAGDAAAAAPLAAARLQIAQHKAAAARWSGRETWGPWRKGPDYLRIEGSVSAQHRQDMVEKFEKRGGPDVFLISTMAGNMGINLVAANRVVLLDTSWNPANDRQALFRCFRFGQRKHVFIYRLVSQGVERVIYKRANQKELLAHRVVDDQQFQNIHKASHLEIRNGGDDTDNDDDGEDDNDALAQDSAFKRVIDRHRAAHLFSLKETNSLKVEDEGLDEEALREAQDECVDGAARAGPLRCIYIERKSTRACALPDLELMTAPPPPANRSFEREIAGRPTLQQEAAQLAQQEAARNAALQAQQHAALQAQQRAAQQAAQFAQAQRERQQRPLFTLNRPTYMNSRAQFAPEAAADGALQQVIDARAPPQPPDATAAPLMQPPAASSRMMRAFNTLLPGWGHR